MHFCFVCSASFDASTSLLSHLKFFHPNIIACGKLKCMFPECVRQYDNFKSFSKHINSHKIYGQAKQRKRNAEEQLVTVHLSEGNLSPSNNPDNIEMSNNIALVSSSDQFDKALVNAVVTYIASLYDSMSLTETQIQNIIDAHKQLLGAGFLSILKDKVLQLLHTAPCQENIDRKEVNEIGRMFDSCQNMYAGFDTQHLRLKEFENCGSFIAPQAYNIGHAADERNSASGVIVTPIELKGQFIPMRKMLKGFLELPGVLSTILNYQRELEEEDSGTVRNIVQGKLWKDRIKPKFEGKTVLPLIGYFDDYESNKEKGTHTCVHKLGATYYRIATLPPEHQASLENIFLATLFHSGDRAFGNASVFRKFLNELKYIEKTGISVVTYDGTVQIFFALCLFTGDNLGANGVLGFVESFSANHFCRVCKEHKLIMQHQLVSNSEKRRNKLDHALDVAMKNESETGIKEACIFDELESFHVVDNVHLDIMHDLDEGVWKYLMVSVLNYFVIKKKRFTIDQLNNVIQGFDYGKSEHGNKPAVLTEKNIRDKTIPFSSTEMRCLMRYFGLMVGHLIKDEDMEVWNLYLTARQIIDLLTAPYFAMSNIDKLKNLIRDHHRKFLELFNGHLYPKMHFLIHYPDLIPEVGPLEPLSCVRMEAKHREGKIVAFLSSNRVNLPLTVAKRHQLKFCHRLLAERGLVTVVTSSPVHVLYPDGIENFPEFCKFLSNDDLNNAWNLVKWVAFNNIKFDLKMAVLFSSSSDVEYPTFGCIQAIHLVKDTAFFLLQTLNTVDFNSHVHAYEVTFGKEWRFLKYDDLMSHLTFDIRSGVNGKKYICSRYAL